LGSVADAAQVFPTDHLRAGAEVSPNCAVVGIEADDERMRGSLVAELPRAGCIASGAEARA
jgi:hypothetical protein